MNYSFVHKNDPFPPTFKVAAVGKVSVLFEAKALLGEGPFYDQAREELVWVNFKSKTINLLDVNTQSNRSLQFEDSIGAAIPCQDDDSKLVAMIGRSICLVDRESGGLKWCHYPCNSADHPCNS